MGNIFSRKKTFAQELADIEAKIDTLEDYVGRARMTQHKVFTRIIIYSIVLEVILALWIYLQTLSVKTVYGKLIYASYLLLFPIFIFAATKLFNTIYKKIIYSNEKKLDSLKSQLQQIIDERKKETDFELINKYEEKKKRGSTSGLKQRTTPNQIQNQIQNQLTPKPNINTQNTNQPNINNINPSPRKTYPTTPSTPPKSFPSPNRNNNNNTNTYTTPNPGGFRPPAGTNYNQQPGNSSPHPLSPPQFSSPPPLQPPRQQHQPGWLDKLVDYIISDGPKYGSPLICLKCRSHNGYVPTSEMSTIQFRCRYCHAFNQNGKIDEDSIDTNNNNNINNNNQNNQNNNLLMNKENENQESNNNNQDKMGKKVVEEKQTPDNTESNSNQGNTSDSSDSQSENPVLKRTPKKTTPTKKKH